MRTNHRDRRHIIIIRGVYCHHLFIFLITIIPDIIKCSILLSPSSREWPRWLHPEMRRSTISMHRKTQSAVGQDTGLTFRLLHAVAELPVPVVPKVLPPTKSRLHRLTLICNSNLPPSLQTLGEIQLYNTDEDVISVIGSADRSSGTLSPGLVIGKYSGIK
jgi:hypothetical protein